MARRLTQKTVALPSGEKVPEGRMRGLRVMGYGRGVA